MNFRMSEEHDSDQNGNEVNENAYDGMYVENYLGSVL